MLNVNLIKSLITHIIHENENSHWLTPPFTFLRQFSWVWTFCLWISKPHLQLTQYIHNPIRIVINPLTCCTRVILGLWGWMEGWRYGNTQGWYCIEMLTRYTANKVKVETMDVKKDPEVPYTNNWWEMTSAGLELEMDINIRALEANLGAIQE